MSGVQLSQLCSILPICYIFVIISMCTFPCSCSTEEKVFVTMVTVRSRFTGSEQPYYDCYVNSPDLDVTVSTRRVIPTRKDSIGFNRNPAPPNPVQTSSDSYPSGATVFRINLNFYYNYEFGTYACDASWEDGRTEYTTSVSNFIMLSNGRIYPASHLVTQTVNVGDRNVNIEMYLESTVDEDDLEWRHNSIIIREAGSSPGTYSFSGGIRESDEGVYICYEDYLWEYALHGMQRLIVRGCQANRWGPPLCNGICDNCYHGGVCDDETGRCICPPGFMGLNCLGACGPNKFGYNCEFSCGDYDNSCLQHQFCLIDPYGCSCSTGINGLNCNVDCAQGTFGANCLQDCHCRQYCNIFTGECPGTCEQGWSGQSCQIPDICPNDYYGSDCVEKCHCKDDASCDKETGECPNQECHPGYTVYRGSVSCQDLPELTYPPEQVSVTSSEVTISWIAWDSERDVGDPPVVSYIPYYKRNSTDEWISGDAVDSEETLEFRVADLEADISYMFVVAAVREGFGGEGPRGPSLMVKTLCDVEPSTPVEVTATLTTMNQVRVTWRVTEEIMCSTGISNFSVYYVSEGSSKEQKFVTMVSADVMETVIKSSDLGNGSHTFYVTFTTDVESTLNIQGDKSSNDTVYLKPQDTTSDMINGSPQIVLFIVPVLAALILLCIVVVFILLRRKKKRRKESTQDVYEDTPCDENKAPNSNLSGENEGVESKLDKSDETVMVDIKKQTASLKRSSTLEEYQETEDSEDENAEHIYSNLQAPDPIKVTMFEDYVKSNADNLEQEFEILKKGKLHQWTIAESQSNKKKNRFKNMLTYDHSRVVLNKIPGDLSSDYYNASHIQNQKGENAFIASQGPNIASLDDFWRTVYQQNVSTIVMITNLYEGGKDRCSQYWPEAEGSTKSFGNLEIAWSKTSLFSDFVIRNFTLRHGKEKDEIIHHIQQFHFLTWPDMSVPKEVTPVLEFVKQVKLAGKEKKTPTLVHCSAGIGRTGTFIALSSLMDVLRNEKVLSVFDFVEQMRENRINMVQTSKQYLFLYKCLLEFHQTRHTEIPAGLLGSFDLNSKKDILLQEHKLLTEIGDVILKMKKNQDGLKEDNKPRNRFPEKVPYDGSRPFLVSWGSGGNDEGYINATILKSFTKQDAFISTQTPLPNTIEDFWKMVFDWNCSLIVMLNQLDPDDETCMQFWSDEDSAEFGSMTITCVVEEDETIFTRRVFEISHVHSEGKKSIHHLQLHSWPPESNLSAVLGLIQEVEKLQHHLSIMSPIVVHCIDGVGRSGVFVTVLSELERIEKNNSIDVFRTVRQLRQRHPDFLSNKEDYLLCYQLLQAHLIDTCEYQNI